MSFADALSAALGPIWQWTWPVLAAALVLLLWLTPAARKRLAAAALMGLAAGVCFALAAVALWRGAPASEPSVRALSGGGQLIAALAAINVGGVLLFDLLLPRLRVKLSALARDLILAAAYAMGILAALTAVGVNLSGLIATSAVMTAILAFALQDTLGNVLGGMVLQLDKTLEVGDWVKVGDDVGVVKEIRWRQTQIVTSVGDTIVVPNSAMMKGTVTALGRRDGHARKRRYSIQFAVPYNWRPGEVVAAVENAVRYDHPGKVASDPAPQCLVTAFEGGRAAYELRYWTGDLADDDAIASEMRLRAFNALARAGIALAVEPTQAVSVEDGKAVRERRDADERARRLAMLRGVDLFKSLNDDELATLADRLKPAPFSRGEAVTRQGAAGHWLYLLAKGDAEVHLAGDGHAATEKVAHLKAGDFLGEMALMTGEPRSATVLAAGDVLCYRLDSESFRDVLARRPEIAENVALVLAERRVKLDSARGSLDLRRREESLRAAQGDLLSRIRRFFALA